MRDYIILVCIFIAVVFSIDAMLQTEDAHMELCRALSVSRLPESCLKLRINKLDMSCLGVARIVVLLELLDPEVRPFDPFLLFISIIDAKFCYLRIVFYNYIEFEITVNSTVYIIWLAMMTQEYRCISDEAGHL